MTRQASALSAFEQLWETLFTTPVHLDSALSKLPKPVKASIARVIPRILLRPASQAEALGVGMSPGEPWSVAGPQLAHWRPAKMMAERLLEALSGALPDSYTSADDFPPWMELDGAVRDALAQEPPLALRATRAYGVPKLLAALQKASLPVKVSPSAIAPGGVVLSGYAPVMQLEAYEAGGFEIQDEGSQLMAFFALWPELVAPLLSEKPGPVRERKLAVIPANPPAWTVVDACAGAGGKSLALADLLGGKGRVYAYDVSEKKLQALRRRSRRAGLTSIQTVSIKEGSESEVVSKFRRRANVVLVDAPCSGWGVLRRNPDIKWRQEPGALERLPALQKRLLDEYSGLVAPGGRLVFGVCTFRPQETRAVVEHFLESHPEFTAREGGYLGPGPSCDGFFMQAFERKAKT